MAEPRRLQRLSASDIFFLSWDDFGWSGDIGALAVLDGAPYWTATAASGSRRSARGSSRDSSWSPASGSACTGPH